ncbi:DUF6629 family protein [Kitasatospora sp. NPDC096147]|uniref:DUF6629 family protein n=1 Tax=Kitasatospora sp. NPDC096147 TaxID=3364093 RepID=UPI0038069281
MCWSAQADLVMGAGVSGLGVVCLGAVRDRRQLPLAALPLVLGVHQLVEAVVWLGEEGRIGPGLARSAGVGWALIAMPLLALLVPVGAWRAAGRPRRLVGFVAIGLVTAVVLTLAVLGGPVTAEVRGHTLEYAVGVPFAPVFLTTYLLAVLGPLVLNPVPELRLLGWSVAVAAGVCALLWRTAFVSTWCALAALASVLLLRWLRRPSSEPER